MSFILSETASAYPRRWTGRRRAEVRALMAARAILIELIVIAVLNRDVILKLSSIDVSELAKSLPSFNTR